MCVVEIRTCVGVCLRVSLRITYGDTLPFPDPAAPPKKPPRPGAPGHLGSLASLSSPGDGYNEGVKVGVSASRSGLVTCDTKQSRCRAWDGQSGGAVGPGVRLVWLQTRTGVGNKLDESLSLLFFSRARF